MKIGFVLDDGLDSTDGVQQYISTLGNWYKTHEHEVHYLVGHTKRQDIDNVHSLSRTIRVKANQNKVGTPLPVKNSLIKNLLKRENFDVLHVQMPYSPLLAGKIINNAPKRTAIVGTFHILPSSKIEHIATKALGVSLRKSLKRFDRIISVSEPAARFANQTFGVDSMVIPNAVDVANFQKGKKIKRLANDKLTIVYLGRLVKRKGCSYLLDALGVLNEKNRLANVQILILSKGPLEKKLKNQARKLGLDQKVEFTGFVEEEEKPDYLASADIAVFPSTGGESFGIVLVEAMAAGAEVVIAGDNPGYRSVIGNASKQLVNPKNTQEFADLLNEFITNKSKRRNSKKVQAELVKQFDVENVGNKLLNIYKDILKNK